MAKHMRVQVFAGAKHEYVSEEDGKLRIFVREPPLRNLANRRVIEIIALREGVSSGLVRIVAGHRSPNKTVEVPDERPESL